MSKDSLEFAFQMLLCAQFLHSIEELSTGFHAKWYLFRMPFLVFLLWEILFQLFWISILFLPNIPNRDQLMNFFLWLMLANGIQHLVWAGIKKKYVPGLGTAPIFIAIFLWLHMR